MKTHLYQAVLLAGVIGFGAPAARGQALKVNIPFRFQTSNAEMGPGEYSVNQLTSGSPVIVLYNRDTHKSDMIMARSRIEAPSNTRPRLVFNCSENRCALAEIWGATAGGGVQVWPRQTKPRDPERLAVVYFEPAPAGK
jgi:hypothetical protein